VVSLVEVEFAAMVALRVKAGEVGDTQDALVYHQRGYGRAVAL
jgi:hypothetical protein